MDPKLLASTAIIGAKVLNDDQRSCVDALEQALELARDGGVHGMAIALAMDGGWSTAIAGTRPGDLHLACHDLQNKILDAVVNSPKTKATARIVRGRMA
jgi:hypothetical protein